MRIIDIARKRNRLLNGFFIYIGGLDVSKFSTKQGFSDYFRINFDPANPVVIPVGNIREYYVTPASSGKINIQAKIAQRFEVPSGVFNNYASESDLELLIL